MKILDCLKSSEGNVWKYIFSVDGAIIEAVLYRYKSFENRTVLCISVSSGCAVGCNFCGTGKKFIKNLRGEEIVEQVKLIFKDKGIEDINSKCSKLQIMFMSMGEPFLNYPNVEWAIKRLNLLYPNAQLLVSTIVPDRKSALSDFLFLSQRIDKIGLQFSIHKAIEKDRNILIPFKSKMSIEDIRDYGISWFLITGRKPYINYCVDDTTTWEDLTELAKIFSPVIFCLTFSVVCSKDETMKNVGFRNLERIREIEKFFLDKSYDTRIFDPAGQDDIGGGCGQLWHFQKGLKSE